jgi:hypothetical protein
MLLLVQYRLTIHFLLGADWHFLAFTTEGLYCTSAKEYQISLTKSMALHHPDVLHSQVKQVLCVIVGLLKDRISVDSSPASKKARIQKCTPSDGVVS